MKWLLIAIIVAATSVGEVLQAIGMRRHGEIRDFRPGALGRAASTLARNGVVIGSVVAMAVSFFAYLGLLSFTDLSFAVPVTAVTYVVETALAKYVLKERVNWRPVAQAEVAGLMKFVPMAGARGESTEQGIQLALEAILVSPDFLFRIEHDPRSEERR